MVQSRSQLDSAHRLQHDLARFAGLPPARRSLLLRTGLVVALVRLGLGVLPFRRLERHLTTLGQRLPRPWGRAPRPDEVGWAVALASRAVPGASCLPQALAAQWLLTRHGYATRLHIGFARTEREGAAIAGHAWLECEGQVVCGGGPLERFTVVTTLHR